MTSRRTTRATRAIGVPQFGYKGDIRFLGALGEGPLPLDRPHVVKVFGNYVFNFGLNAGVGLTMNSGKPLTGLAANPNYANGGEIPTTPRGAGIETVDGFRTRTPFEYNTDAHVDYAFKFGGNRLVLLADIFNLFDQQRTIDYDNWVELERGVANPDFGKPVSEVVAGSAVPDAAADSLRREVRVLGRSDGQVGQAAGG